MSSSKKAFHNSTVNNTNNNSISSLKASKNLYISAKNNLFNKKIPTFKQKTSLKHYNIGENMYLYQKKKDSQKNMNSLGQNFPIDLLTKTNNQYKYSNNNYLKSNNYIKYNGNNNINKNINTSINKKNIKINKNNNINKGNYIYNNININNSHIIKNNQKNIIQNQNNQNFTFINNNNISHNNKNKSSNPINTYIINTLNVSEKDFLSSGIPSTKQQKNKPQINKEYEIEINKLIKEKEENENIIKKQEKLIEKLIEDNDKLDNKIKSIEYENKKIYQKIESHQENQEQLIMLVKIIQKSGVDVEELIDKWNNEIDLENNNSISCNSNNNNNNITNNNESYTDSINELNSKIDPSSFIPINIEEPHVNKKVFNGIPKLNFDILKNNKEVNKKKFRNNSK